MAKLIRDGMGTRVYYVSLGGFDTHANQLGAHGNLMRQLGGSLNAFYKDLKAQGNTGRATTGRERAGQDQAEQDANCGPHAPDRDRTRRTRESAGIDFNLACHPTHDQHQ